MDKSTFKTGVADMWEEFGEIEPMNISPGWDDELMKRLASSPTKSRLRGGYISATIACVLFVNIAFIVNTFRAEDSRRHQAMEMVSRELLINPISY